MATANAGRADKGSSQAPARAAGPCGAVASRFAAKISAGTKGNTGQTRSRANARETPA